MLLDFIKTSDSQDFTSRAVTFLVEKINAAIAERGECIVGLSGGSTPKPIYEELGKQNLDWSKVHFFLIDERYVDPSSPDSNQKMIRETLLNGVTLRSGRPRLEGQSNFIFPNTTLPLDECIHKYAFDLHTLWDEYLTDVTVLGMGDDGHIASLFPPLAENLMDDSALVHHTITDKFAIHDRITLSLNAVASTNSSLMLLKGDAKRKVWDEMMASSEGEARWPVKRVMEVGEVTVMWTV